MPKETNEDLSQYFNCIKCGQCCSFFELTVNPQDLLLGGLYVNEAFKEELGIDFGPIGQCSVRIVAPCGYLDTATGLCKIHDNRPKVCKNHFCQKYPKIEDEDLAE